MTDQTPGADRSLREQRERTIERLCAHFAKDQLTLEELERRIDLAERSRASGELAALLADLQPRTPAVAAERPVPAPATQPAAYPVPVNRSSNGAIIAILGGTERRGRWVPAEHNFVLALMGGAELDFRDVQLPPGETEIFILACMGGVDIIVPPELAVETGGFAIMGGFGHQQPPTRPGPDAPVLKVHGFALMGGVDIAVRLPGETARDAKRRERERRRGRP